MITSDPDELFDPGVLRRYEAASLLARRLARGGSRAERRSHARGAGVEFAEYRPLVAGDDWRHIDWHAYARWRQLVLKLFVEEEDLHLHLLLDCSRSMDWGHPAKFDQARRLLGGLAYIALANLDRAGFVPLGGGRGIPPGRGRERLSSFLAALAACPLNPEARPLEDSVRSWLSTRPRRGFVILLSDLFGTSTEDALRALDRLRHAGHEVAALQILASDETTRPPPGEYEIEDCESGRVLRVVVDPQAAEAFAARASSFLESIDRGVRSRGIAFLRSGNETPIEQVFSSVLSWQ